MIADSIAEREWFTPDEAAEYLRVSIPTIYRLTQRGRLQAYHVGASRRYRREDLDAVPMVRNREGDSNGEPGA